MQKLFFKRCGTCNKVTLWVFVKTICGPDGTPIGPVAYECGSCSKQRVWRYPSDMLPDTQRPNIPQSQGD